MDNGNHDFGPTMKFNTSLCETFPRALELFIYIYLYLVRPRTQIHIFVGFEPGRAGADRTRDPVDGPGAGRWKNWEQKKSFQISAFHMLTCFIFSSSTFQNIHPLQDEITKRKVSLCENCLI